MPSDDCIVQEKRKVNLPAEALRLNNRYVTYGCQIEESKI